ncbi:exonuclease domain-containing protein [Saccharopolyspora tripterygii]
MKHNGRVKQPQGRITAPKGRHPLRLFEPVYLSRSAPGTPARDMLYSAIDVETTGLDPRRQRICEVAIVRFRGDGTVLDEYSSLINPQRKIGKSTEIHGISDEDVAGAPTFAEALPDILQLLSGTVVVAHNLEFEDKFLKAEVERVGHERPKLVGLCSFVTSRAQLDGPFYSLKTLYKTATDEWIEDAHTALGDSRALAKLMVWLLETAPTPLNYVGPEPQRSNPAGPVARIHPRAVQLANRDRGYLGALAHRFPRTGLQHPVSPTAERAYVEALNEIIADKRIVEDEGWRMEQLARQGGFSQQRLVQLHQQAWERSTASEPLDSPESMTSFRRNQLAQLAHDLGHRDLGKHLVVEAIEKPATNRHLRNWRIGIDGPEDAIAELTAFVTTHGGNVAKRLTDTVRFVAAADPKADTPQLRKARELGLTIVSLDKGTRSVRKAVDAEETRIRALFEEQRQWKQRREQERAERAAYFQHRWRRREDPPFWGWEESARPITLPSYR